MKLVCECGSDQVKYRCDRCNAVYCRKCGDYFVCAECLGKIEREHKPVVYKYDGPPPTVRFAAATHVSE